MIRINLIPHRAEFRQKQIIEYITVFASSVLLIIGLVVVIDIWGSSELTDLQEEKVKLQDQNAQLSKKIGELRNLDSLRKDVESKLQIVDELQAGRFRTLVTLNAIAEAIPQNIWIDNMKDSNGQIIINGYGESSKAVANFMRSLEMSIVFSDVKLDYDQEEIVDQISVRKFALNCHRLTLVEQEAEKTKVKGAEL